MNTIYSNYYVTETGLPVEVTPTKSKSYLPHSYYLSMVISELSNSNKDQIVIKIDDIVERLHNLIEFIHEDVETKNTVSEYFRTEENVLEILINMYHSGLLRVGYDTITLSYSQLDFIRDYLLEYH